MDETDQIKKLSDELSKLRDTYAGELRQRAWLVNERDRAQAQQAAAQRQLDTHMARVEAAEWRAPEHGFEQADIVRAQVSLLTTGHIENARETTALRNVLSLAHRIRTTDPVNAAHLVRFCAEAGVVSRVTRGATALRDDGDGCPRCGWVYVCTCAPKAPQDVAGSTHMSRTRKSKP